MCECERQCVCECECVCICECVCVSECVCVCESVCVKLACETSKTFSTVGEPKPKPYALNPKHQSGKTFSTVGELGEFARMGVVARNSVWCTHTHTHTHTYIHTHFARMGVVSQE